MQSPIIKFTLIATLLVSNISFATTKYDTKSRGKITEFDPGPSTESKWIDLFAETPNYRAFGEAIISGSGEKFRWNMGPMFYRGRLNPNAVKIFVIGQEGAQDENLSNRSFTGSTGTRMQKFLNYFGITKSYLFMNTFVYTITGQYSLYGDDATNEYKKKQWKELMWLAQNEDSIVVQHRHKMFNHVLETNKNSLALVIGVGTAGKESLVTWFNSVSSNSCNYSKLTSSFCEGKGKLSGIIGIGVRHPGAASARNAGSTATGGLISDFKNKAKIVQDLINKDKNWMPIDSDGERNFSKEFKYGYASIPHRDFSFGTPWTLGEQGTTSNRRGSDTIQIFSQNGCYNNGAKVDGRCKTIPPNEKPSLDTPDERIHYLYYKNPRNLIRKNDQPEGFSSTDLPFEPPKNAITRYQFDAGPGELSEDLINFYLAVAESPFKDEIIQHESFGHTGMYRGNTTNPEILILADQQGHTDMFSGRALTGEAGQKLQGFLNGAGLQNKYLIIRSLPVDCLDDITNKISCLGVMYGPKVSDSRANLLNKIIQRSVKVILSVGEHSKKIISDLRLELDHHHIDLNESNLQNNFQNIFNKIKTLNVVKNDHQYTHSNLSPIPRGDLPYSSRWWMGTSGDRVSRSINMTNIEVRNGQIRGYDLDTPNGDYYKLYAPSWSTSWTIEKLPLSEKELDSIRKFKDNFEY